MNHSHHDSMPPQIYKVPYRELKGGEVFHISVKGLVRSEGMQKKAEPLQACKRNEGMKTKLQSTIFRGLERWDKGNTPQY